MEFIGVTSCATGIAHSYMAAEALEKIAKKLKMNYKVEVQGALGIENRISSKDLQGAQVIVFANDVSITDVERFTPYEKIILRSSPHDVIRHPDKIVAALENKLPQ